jgi:hypothetical protein
MSSAYTGPFNYPTVNLASNAYMVEVKLPGTASVHFNGVRIDYGYSTSLPVVVR